MIIYIIFEYFLHVIVPYFYITECGDGWYGITCSQQCAGHCRSGISCNHVTGQCDGGCDEGWTEAICDKGYFCDITPKRLLSLKIL